MTTLRPGVDGTPSATCVNGSLGSQFVAVGSRTDTSRPRDLDLDGRPDLVQTASGHCAAHNTICCQANGDCPLGDICTNVGASATYFNQGGVYGSGVSFTSTPQAIFVNGTCGGGSEFSTWEVQADMVDLDGDGIPEGVSRCSGGGLCLQRITTPPQPPRLLATIANGRGATTTVTYASMNSAAVVQDSMHGKSSPATQWVVQSLSTNDSVSGTTTATSYKYIDPHYGADDRGKYAMRGFQEVDTTLPTNAMRVDLYDYTTDWSGRLVTTKTIPAEAPLEVRSITDTTWQAFTLFSGAITTFHATAVDHWTCKNGQAETACRNNTDTRTHTVATMKALGSTTSSGGPALMWKQVTSRLQPSLNAADGDRAIGTAYVLAADATNYRLLPQTVTKSQQVAGQLVTYAMSSHSFDGAYRFAVTDEVWVDNNDANRMVTRRAYDSQTGNVIQRWKPVQNPIEGGGDGQSVTYTYDSRKLFVATQVDEAAGSPVASMEQDFVYEYGTGTKLETLGPNVPVCSTNNPPNCPSGTPLQGRSPHRRRRDRPDDPALGHDERRGRDELHAAGDGDRCLRRRRAELGDSPVRAQRLRQHHYVRQGHDRRRRPRPADHEDQLRVRIGAGRCGDELSLQQ